jgi:hypothetical protein
MDLAVNDIDPAVHLDGYVRVKLVYRTASGTMMSSFNWHVFVSSIATPFPSRSRLY